jgi:two-component system, NtrC family, nitrogen regulation sensor histidine kinase NtrY
MFKIIKNFNWIITSSFLCIFLGIITFLTFINEGFVPLKGNNLQILLILDLILLSIFFFLIFRSLAGIYLKNKKNKTGSQTNLKYISLFSLFTFIPSLLIAIFSLFIFNFGVQNFFNDQITKAVTNSNEVAQNYLDESKKNVEADSYLMSVGINRGSSFFYSNINRFKNIIKSEKLIRRIDDVYLIDSSGNIIISETNNPESDFVIPAEEDFARALEGLPVLISNNLDTQTSVMIKITNLIDTYLYISRDIDTQILKYLNETEEAVDFYYSVESSQFGIKITFAIIYIIVVTLLLFLSTVIAINYATRLTRPIINLITASENISKGQLDTKVPAIETDEELELLNTNFNNMIERLKKQQDKLLITERYSAWESVARKLAHEIKNPLTPIQLSIDRLQEKYSNKITEGKENFTNYLDTINRQIKDIENLVNEFSSFARMPSPVMKKIDILKILERSINFLKPSLKSSITLKNSKEKFYINGDEEQLNRVFINLIKNSDESCMENIIKIDDFKGKIEVDIESNNDYIFIKLIDNGTGILDTKKIMTPYFTTKKNGTGLGLPIVSKIINEHSGDILISNNKNEGVNILISLPTYQ